MRTSISVRLLTGAMCAALAMVPGGVARGTTGAAATQAVPSARPTAVTLITGDRVLLVERHGRPSVTVQPGSGGSGAGFVSYGTPSGDEYVIPDIALPAVAKGVLDRSLFDVTLLRKLEGAGAALRLAVSERPGCQAGRARARHIVLRVAEFGRFWHRLRSAASPTGLDRCIGSIRVLGPGRTSSPHPVHATVGRSSTSTHKLTISAIDRNGNPSGLQAGELDSFRPADQTSGNLQRFLASGTYQLPAGTYVLHGLVATGTYGQPGYSLTFAMMVINLTQDTTVVLDARKGVPLKVSVNDPNAVPYATYIGNQYKDGKYLLSSSVAWAGPAALYATPMTATGIGFFWHTTWLQSGWSITSPSKFRYDLGQSYDNGVPSSLSFSIDTATLASIRVHYDAQGATEYAQLVHWLAFSDGGQEGFQFVSDTIFPETITLYFTPGAGWLRWMWLVNPPQGPRADYPTYMLFSRHAATYQARTYWQTWDSLVIGPDAPPTDSCDQAWADNIFGDGQPGTDASDQRTTAAVLRIYRDRNLFASFNLLKTPYLYLCQVLRPGDTLEVTATRQDPQTPVSLIAGEKWKLVRRRLDSPVLPLQFVRFNTVGLSDLGQAPAGTATHIDIHVKSQPDAPIPDVTSLHVEVSFNDGRTWRNIAATGSGRTWTATVHNPPTAGYVSLRATAVVTNGNSVTDTIIRAYRVVTA